MTQKRATIYEVAARAGVSHQTVSRYLRNNGGLKPATVIKVQAAIDELSYRPNLIARSMRTRRTGRIAILLPPATTSLPLRLMSAAATTAHAGGYAIDILGLEGSGTDRVARAQELADSGEFEGILALAVVGDQPTPGSTTSIVIVSDYDDELRGLGALADGAACGEVVERLATLGHTHFLHLAGPQDYASARNRRKTFVETTAQLGVSGTVVNGTWSGQSGYDLVLDLPLDTPVTAVVAANDLVATGAIRAALSRGWRVPSDLSVVGWDDNELCRFTTPSLSTVAIDRERQGREAMERLIALIRGTEPPLPDHTSLHTFIQRESIGPVPTRRKPLRGANPP
jgi:LacI family transcriptional regulator